MQIWTMHNKSFRKLLLQFDFLQLTHFFLKYTRICNAAMLFYWAKWLKFFVVHKPQYTNYKQKTEQNIR